MDIQSSVLSEIFVLYPVHVPSWLTPVKPPTLAHGGISWLLYNGNSTGLLCVVDPWAELQLRGQIMEAYDSVALYLNDVATPVDSATVLPGDEQKRIPLNVPHGQLIHGVNRLHYKVTRLSGNVEPSRDLLVLYHLRVPANLDLVIPPDVVANGVSAARAAQGVEFRLSYVTVEKYDIARLQIGNKSFTLEVSDPAKPVTKTLYLEDFKTVGDGRFEIDFVVTDQLGNSAISATKTLDVHIARLDLLPPTVRGQSGNNFSPTQPEIRVLVPQGPLLPTDLLSVKWTATSAVPAASYSSPQRLVSAGLAFAVPRSVLAYSLGKTVTVTYTVERNGVPTTSPPLTLNILPLPTTALNPPKIVEADANNFLDIVALGSKDAIIHALLHSLIEKDQQCWLSLEGEKADGTAHNRPLWTGHPARVNDTWINQGFWPHGVPNSYLKDLGHGSKLTIKYKVALNKSNREAEATVFPDRVYTIKAVELVIPTLTNVLDDKGVEVLEAGFTVSTSLTLKGAASKGLQVEIFDGSGASAVSKGKATADEKTGLWSFAITVPVGARRLYAKSLYHSTPVYSNVRTLTVTAATAPTITTVKGSPSGDNIPENGTTVETAVTLTGTASKGQEVEIFDGSGASAVSKGIATAHATSGIWEHTFPVSLGARRLYAEALYPVSPVYSNVRLLTVTAASAPTLTSAKGSPSGNDIPPNGITVETAVTLSGAAAKGQEVEIFDGATSKGRAPVNATTGVWTLLVSGLTVAVHNFKARALYGTGAESAVRTLTVTAAAAPTITTVKGSPSGADIPNGTTTSETAVVLTGTASKGQKVDVLDGTVSRGQPTANVATGVWTQPVSGLTTGPHSFTAKALYGAQPVSVARTLTVQIIPTLNPGPNKALNLVNFIVAQARPPVYVPAEAIYTQAASGGQPPYTYASNNSGVASVAAGGTVTCRNNGDAVITVTDSRGTKASYTLTVKGIRTLLQNDATWRTWPEAYNYCVARGGRLATVAEMSAFYNLYAREARNVAALLGWPLIQTHPSALFGAWLLEGNGAGAHYFFNVEGTPSHGGGGVLYGLHADGYRRPALCLYG